MGRHFVKFRCHSCGNCCTDVVCLPTPFDVIRIVRDTGRHPLNFLEFLTPEEIDGVDDDDPTWLKVGAERYMMALRRDEETGCVFLDNNSKLCTIYESRPLLCRLFPFKVEEDNAGNFEGFTLHDDVCCPLNTDGRHNCNRLYKIYEEDSGHHEDYDALVAVFNRKRYKRKRPEDFIDMFVTIEHIRG